MNGEEARKPRLASGTARGPAAAEEREQEREISSPFEAGHGGPQDRGSSRRDHRASGADTDAGREISDIDRRLGELHEFLRRAKEGGVGGLPLPPLPPHPPPPPLTPAELKPPHESPSIDASSSPGPAADGRSPPRRDGSEAVASAAVDGRGGGVTRSGSTLRGSDRSDGGDVERSPQRGAVGENSEAGGSRAWQMGGEEE